MIKRVQRDMSGVRAAQLWRAHVDALNNGTPLEPVKPQRAPDVSQTWKNGIASALAAPPPRSAAGTLQSAGRIPSEKAAVLFMEQRQRELARSPRAKTRARPAIVTSASAVRPLDVTLGHSKQALKQHQLPASHPAGVKKKKAKRA